MLILDEPTDGLDPNQKHEVRTLINALAPRKAIIISTHLLEEVDAVCTRAIIIAAGRILADGTPAELEARSRHHNAVRLALARRRASTRPTALMRLPGVAAVEEVEDDEGRGADDLPARTAAPSSPRSPISCAPRGWPVTALRVERGRLDDVFRAITTGQAA